MRFIATLLLAAAGAAQAPTGDPHALARDIFKQLIEINSTDSPQGSVTRAAEAMAERFRAAGFPESDIHLVRRPDRPEKANLVVRYRGVGAKKPMLIIGHLDVVQALPKDWTSDPFRLVEKDGYLYGRGTQDMKGSDAIVVADLIRLHQEGYKPESDIIVALTADEEGGSANGVDYLLKHDRDLVDAEFVLNPDGGGPVLKDGKPYLVDLTASEKAYADYTLTAVNPGGHSSVPTPDNAIYHVVDALARLERYQFPVELNPVTRAYFERMAQLEGGQLAADMRSVANGTADTSAMNRMLAIPEIGNRMHTTCVATTFDAGHARNALPQTAVANVNCRIVPGHTREQIRQQLVDMFADPKLRVEYVDNDGRVSAKAPDTGSMPPPPIRPEFLRAVEQAAAKYYPGAPVVPAMDAGASDDIYTNAAGIPSYEVSAVGIDFDDVRAHGKDERIRIADFNTGVDFYYDLLKRITAP